MTTQDPQRPRCLYLSNAELSVLQDIAVHYNAIPSQGSQTATPTWRTLVKWVAQGKLEVTPAQGKE